MDSRKKIQAGALVRAWALCLLKVHAKASCIFFSFSICKRLLLLFNIRRTCTICMMMLRKFTHLLFFKSYSLTKNPWADVLSILSPGID